MKKQICLNNFNQFFQISTKQLSKNLKLKEKIDDLDKIIEKVSNIGDDQDEQKIFEFEFFTGGYNHKFNSFVRSKGLSTEIQEFVDYLQWDLCKKILENNNLKIFILKLEIFIIKTKY